MASSGGSALPRKPWEGAQSASSGPSPFRPASSEMSSTAAVVESAGVAEPADKGAITNPLHNGSIISRPAMPIRSYGGPGYSGTNYNQYNNVYSTTPYGSTYNNYNRGYGLNNGMYGGGMYGGGYGSYGGGMHGSNYGGGMYGSPYGMGMGMGMGSSMGMGMNGPGSFPNGAEDPNNPFGSAGPPSFWQSLLQKLHWMVVVFGNVAGLIAENTQTFNLITTALFQFFERSGMLAGYVIKLLRMWHRPKVLLKAPKLALPAPKNTATLQIEGPKSSGGSWDNLWTNELAG